MRPGRAEDLPAVVRLWQEEVEQGRRDSVPTEARIVRSFSGFDWPSRSRCSEGAAGGVEGTVLVTDRATPTGTMTRVELATAAGAPAGLRDALARWGLGLSRAAGAASAQVWCGRGAAGWAGDLGLELVRPWWRMDQSLTGLLPTPQPVPGYALRAGSGVATHVWVDVYNRAFADHWGHSPKTEDELMAGRSLELASLLLAPDGSPAAMTLSQIEESGVGAQPRPVGIVGAVGTLPAHRRRGLATWLVAEALVRLRDSGAKSASLYVDGWNENRAADVYRKLGFEVAFETEVWEARFP